MLKTLATLPFTEVTHIIFPRETGEWLFLHNFSINVLSNFWTLANLIGEKIIYQCNFNLYFSHSE